MNRFIIYICMINFLFANSVSKWIDVNRNIIRENIKSVSFQFSTKSNLTLYNKKQINGNIIVGENKKFRYEMGPRVVISDGKVWKSYDARTDQIFIQKPDKKLEKILFSWIKVKKLKALPIKKIDKGIYKIKLPGKNNDIISYFNIATNHLDSLVTSSQNGFRAKIFNINLSVADSVLLNIGTSSSQVFDLR